MKELENSEILDTAMEENGDDGFDEDVERVPPWTRQITVRGTVVSTMIGIIYSIIVAKISLTTGLVPNLNVSAALLSFIFMRAWTKVLETANFKTAPFTRQENTVVQTCAVACYAVFYGGGFGSNLLGLDRKTYELAGADTQGNSAGSVKDPGLNWMIGYLFVVFFGGIFSLIPLRKILIVNYKLPFPTGTATAVLINGFHRSKDDRMTKKQVRGFMKFFSASFLWSFFKWFYSGGEQCGFLNFPTFGLKAFKQSFYFDFNMTYIGAGMICSHIVNLSLLFGAVVSSGIMWPLIITKKGDWFPANVKESSMKSLTGYKVFISIALILGDGLYNFVKVLVFTGRSMYSLYNKKISSAADETNQPLNDHRRDEVFLRETIPLWVPCVAYLVFSTISIIAIPIMFPQLKWYFVLVAYVLAPALSFCNAYGTGLTDMNMGYNYGKAALFLFASISGMENGVVAGLIGCGLVKTLVTVSSDLMQDFKTGHLTLTSPRSMLVSQAVGVAIGCVVAPLSFFLFYRAFDVGNPDGEFKAPYALVFRNMAIIGVEGLSALPRHCLELCCGFFAFAILVNLLRDGLPNEYGKFVPLPMAMAVPFLVGAYFAVDMCVGSLIVFIWHRFGEEEEVALMVPTAASGMICGDGMWFLPSSMLALAKVHPPICMNFSPGKSP